MKWNWGTGIAVVIIVFIVAVISFAWFAGTQSVNLVEKDYYPKGLTYVDKMQRIANSNQLEENIRILSQPDHISISFPAFTREGTPDGSIQFYRPSDYRDDKLFSIQLNDSGYQYIPKSGLLKGKYIIIIEWSYEGIGYHFEETIIN